MTHLFLRFELGPIYLQLGKAEEPEAPEPEPEPQTLVGTSYPMTEYAERPGFRITGNGGGMVTDV